jgi:hypothetical protein
MRTLTITLWLISYCFLGLTNLLIVGVEGYCCTWSYSVTHTHSHSHTRANTLVMTPLNEGSAGADTSTWKHTHSHEKSHHATGGIWNRNPSTGAAADLCISPRRDWGRHSVHFRILIFSYCGYLYLFIMFSLHYLEVVSIITYNVSTDKRAC